MPTAPTMAAVAAALRPSMLPTATSAAGASIGTRSIAVFRTTVGAPDQPAHASADHAAASTNVASAALTRAPEAPSASKAAAANSAAPVNDQSTAIPGDVVAYDVTFGLRLPSAMTAELVAITNAPAV